MQAKLLMHFRIIPLLLYFAFAADNLYCQVKTEEPATIASSFTKLKADFESNFKVVSELPISGRIAFTAKIDGYERILVWDLDSGRIRPLIDGPGNNYYPGWSPDGKQIVFGSDRHANREIYVANWEGLKQRRLTRNSVRDDNPSWHPDGKRIVYYSQTSNSTNLFVLNIKSNLITQITDFEGRNTTPRFSPDGTLVAYSTNRFWPGWDVCTWNLKNHREDCPLKGKLSYCRPAWSSDGKAIFVAYGSSPNVNLAVIKDLNEGRKVRVSNLELREYDPTLVANDKYLLFVAEDGQEGIFNIFAFKQGEKTPKKVLHSSYSLRYLSWTPKTTLELEANRIKQMQKAEEAERKALEKNTPNHEEQTRPQ